MVLNHRNVDNLQDLRFENNKSNLSSNRLVLSFVLITATCDDLSEYVIEICFIVWVPLQNEPFPHKVMVDFKLR